MNLKPKKKVFYWSPCLNKVGTVVSTKNSAIALAKYKKDLYEVYILNVLKCRPSKNRNPLPHEVEQCEPYLKTQLKIIKPKLTHKIKF